MSDYITTPTANKSLTSAYEKLYGSSPGGNYGTPRNTTSNLSTKTYSKPRSNPASSANAYLKYSPLSMNAPTAEENQQALMVSSMQRAALDMTDDDVASLRTMLLKALNGEDYQEQADYMDNVYAPAAPQQASGYNPSLSSAFSEYYGDQLGGNYGTPETMENWT
jgi:hypothetical protein